MSTTIKSRIKINTKALRIMIMTGKRGQNQYLHLSLHIVVNIVIANPHGKPCGGRAICDPVPNRQPFKMALK